MQEMDSMSFNRNVEQKVRPGISEMDNEDRGANIIHAFLKCKYFALNYQKIDSDQMNPCSNAVLRTLDLVWFSGENNIPSTITCFGSEVDDPIR